MFVNRRVSISTNKGVIRSSSYMGPSALEDYFCRSLGMTLVALGVITILLTGSVPLTSTFAECEFFHIKHIPVHLSGQRPLTLPPAASEGVSTEDSDPKSPYALPTLTLTACYHAACAFFGYVTWMQIGSVGFGLSTIGSGFFTAVALWCILFASSEGKISRKTGADKRTSGFPFGNKEADKKRQPGRKGM